MPTHDLMGRRLSPAEREFQRGMKRLVRAIHADLKREGTFDSFHLLRTRAK